MFYFCIVKNDNTALSYGVMATQQILVLLFLVRVQVAQQPKRIPKWNPLFRFPPGSKKLPANAVQGVVSEIGPGPGYRRVPLKTMAVSPPAKVRDRLLPATVPVTVLVLFDMVYTPFFTATFSGMDVV